MEGLQGGKNLILKELNSTTDQIDVTLIKLSNLIKKMLTFYSFGYYIEIKILIKKNIEIKIIIFVSIFSFSSFLFPFRFIFFLIFHFLFFYKSKITQRKLSIQIVCISSRREISNPCMAFCSSYSEDFMVIYAFHHADKCL